MYTNTKTTNNNIVKFNYKVNDIIGPQSAYDAAVLYTSTPEQLSHDARTILGYVYRSFLFDSARNDMLKSFPTYAVVKWVKDEFPKDALV